MVSEEEKRERKRKYNKQYNQKRKAAVAGAAAPTSAGGGGAFKGLSADRDGGGCRRDASHRRIPDHDHPRRCRALDPGRPELTTA